MSHENRAPASPEALVKAGPVPRGDLDGLRRHWASDLVAGFLVFLVALPLCLGIALASGYPPIAGVLSAVVGGLLTGAISDSELTIKGPAAGLIVIAIGCISSFGGTGFADGEWSAGDQHAFECALAVGVAAAAIQVVLGVCRAGVLGELFPTAAVHGMLAAIGIVIVAKQIPVALGESPAGHPLELLLRIPEEIAHANPAIALIGFVSLAILVLWPRVAHRRGRRIPAPVVVLVVTIPLGLALGLDDPRGHAITIAGHSFELSRRFLVDVPSDLLASLSLPDFTALAEPVAWKWVAMFAIIGTLESLLSAKAIELVDPWNRKTDLDRDNTAIGVGNLASAFIGGLPMISEIVRSRANIDAGARTRFANVAHALFLLVMVSAAPALLSLVPLSALGAMLVYTGCRLADPRELAHVLEIGWEQLVVFVATIVGVLATDLLVGIAIGVGVEVLVHVANGAPLRVVFSAAPTVEVQPDGTARVRVPHGVLFSSWLGLRRTIERISGRDRIVVDLSQARFVDHTAMRKLHAMASELAARNIELEIQGLGQHLAISKHPHATRKLARALG